jgi:hypothetical protein
MLSMTTLGAVDWRSDKERIAAQTRGAKKQMKKQNKLLKEQNEILKKQR